MKPLTLAEAAQFLRKSKSWLYQNRTIPRYRPEGTRGWLFNQDELEMWLRNSRIELERQEWKGGELRQSVHSVEISSIAVYHRNPRYR
jgi:excisionase family DNA binding protein